MSAVNVTIIGTIAGIGAGAEDGIKSQTVILQGQLNLSDLSVGGGPLPGGKPPLGIWGGPFDPPHPEHPIVIPKPPDPFPEPPAEGTKPPPPDGGWGYSPEYGWGYFPKPSEPRPKVGAGVLGRK